MAEKVGYLGPDVVTFGYQAAEKFFEGKGVEFIPLKSHSEICKAVASQDVDFGVVAIENAIDGPVSETIHSVESYLRSSGIRIYSEVEIPIEMYYLGQTKDASHPKRVLSHPVALRQCSRFISSLEGLGITIEVRSSTGEAAKEASESNDIAVVASKKAEEVYKLVRIEENPINDNRLNFTRFWILAQKNHKRTGSDKTCILINLEQAKPGGLSKALEFFAKRSINLLIVYPNPIPGRKWEYTFFLEFLGHISDQPMREAFDELSDSGLCLGGPLLLGSYPAAG